MSNPKRLRFIRAIIEKTKNTNLTEDILIKIIEKRNSRDVYKKLEIQVLIHVDHTIEDIIKFFIKNFCCPRKLKEDLIEYYRKQETQDIVSKIIVIKI